MGRFVRVLVLVGLLDLFGMTVMKAKQTQQTFPDPATERGTTESTTTRRHYCEISVTSDDDRVGHCRSILQRELLKSSKPPSTWIFFGDSQMSGLYKTVARQYPYANTTVRQAPGGQYGRCGFLEYCGMERAKVWTPPNLNKSQGPYVHGLQHHFCTDLSHHHKNNMIKATTPPDDDGGGGGEEKVLELLIVEFASDVEQQTPLTNTTQETAVLYVKSQHKREDTVCVVNTGIHDMGVCVQAYPRKCMYFRNVRTYLKLLDQVCGNIVWIGLSSSREDKNQPQSNPLLFQSNKGVYFELEGIEGAIAVDVWNHSMSSVRSDNLHFSQEYYDTLASLFVGFM